MKKAKDTISWAATRDLALALPGVEEGSSYGMPACKVKGKLFLRLKEDGVTIVVRIDQFKREILLHAEPETFFITDHYLTYPWILVRLASVRRETLHELLEQAWRLVAPSRLINDFDKARNT